jgi:hypothetical protein
MQADVVTLFLLRCFAGASEKVKDCVTTTGHIGPWSGP